MDECGARPPQLARRTDSQHPRHSPHALATLGTPDPVFVVDAYTRRILDRHRLVDARANYEDIRELFERTLGPVAEALLKPGSGFAPAEGPAGSCHAPSRMSIAQRTASAQVLNEMHGLIVGVGKNFCKKSQPACERCPLQKFLPGAE